MTLCEGNPPFTSGFSSQMARDAEFWIFLVVNPAQNVDQTVELWWFEMILCLCDITAISHCKNKPMLTCDKHKFDPVDRMELICMKMISSFHHRSVSILRCTLNIIKISLVSWKCLQYFCFINTFALALFSAIFLPKTEIHAIPGRLYSPSSTYPIDQWLGASKTTNGPSEFWWSLSRTQHTPLPNGTRHVKQQ